MKWNLENEKILIYIYFINNITYYDSRNWNEVSVTCLIQLHLLIQISYQVFTDCFLKQSNTELDAWEFLLAQMNAMFS